MVHAALRHMLLDTPTSFGVKYVASGCSLVTMYKHFQGCQSFTIEDLQQAMNMPDYVPMLYKVLYTCLSDYSMKCTSYIINLMNNAVSVETV